MCLTDTQASRLDHPIQVTNLPMPIIRQTNLRPLQIEYDERSLELRHVLTGGLPNANVWNLHSQNSADYKRDFIEIDEAKLLAAIDALQLNLKKLKKIKKHSAPPLGSAR